jgi:hypothetical protein
MYAYLFMGLGILFSMGSILFWLAAFGDTSGPGKGTPWYEKPGALTLFWVLMGFGVVSLVLMAVMMAWEKNECPACLRWRKQKMGSQLLDKRRGFRTVTRADSRNVVLSGGGHGSHQNVFGHGVTYRDEQVRVMVFTYRDNYECRKCGHQWHVVREQVTENFDL